MRRCRSVFLTDEGKKYQCIFDDGHRRDHRAAVHGWNQRVARLDWTNITRKRVPVARKAGLLGD